MSTGGSKERPRWGARATAAVANPENGVFFSIASGWEVAVKLSLGSSGSLGPDRFMPDPSAVKLAWYAGVIVLLLRIWQKVKHLPG